MSNSNVQQAWAGLPQNTRDLVESVLTVKQLEAVKLMNAGYGVRLIARSLDIDRKTAKDRLDAAERKILKALEERGETDGSLDVAARGEDRRLRPAPAGDRGRADGDDVVRELLVDGVRPAA